MNFSQQRFYNFGSDHSEANYSIDPDIFDPQLDVEEPREFLHDASQELFDTTNYLIENPDYLKATAMPLQEEPTMGFLRTDYKVNKIETEKEVK